MAANLDSVDGPPDLLGNSHRDGGAGILDLVRLREGY